MWKATVSRLSAPPTVWALVIATQGHLAVAFGLANQGRVKDASYEPVQDNPQMRPAVATLISLVIKSDKARKKIYFFQRPAKTGRWPAKPSDYCDNAPSIAQTPVAANGNVGWRVWRPFLGRLRRRGKMEFNRHSDFRVAVRNHYPGPQCWHLGRRPEFDRCG